MRLNFLHRLADLPQDLQESVIREAPHTRIIAPPDELGFLRAAFIDLGFENLKLPATARAAILRSFLDAGVRVPGTKYKLRNDQTGLTVVEIADGTEPELPADWRTVILTIDDTNHYAWIGKATRPDQIHTNPATDPAYVDGGDGWVRR